MDWVRVEKERCPDQRRVVDWRERRTLKCRGSADLGEKGETITLLVAPSSSAFVKRNPSNPSLTFKKNNPA